MAERALRRIIDEDLRDRAKRLRLAHGGIGACDDSPITAPGWAADGRGGCRGCRWTTVGDRFDIAEYDVLR